ncbi:flagellar basal-body MS-ring/collar protein FliF [Tuberibacillus sp. Marseille-P3662]|uniref:flagellar basal-body MS-ring/collar protein FliF n=1 Tax=Tuberibacillus sp. Marseille-P3662 TaxID=1965358 RepID=UPI000A1CCDC8|nr:flagellar basal-body MS-ring/collar protein FliF [Tuberibacillus sp. Marseille-P3662]
MKERLIKVWSSIKKFWEGMTKKKRISIVAAISAFILILFIVIAVSSYTTFVPLYKELSPSEAGQIKENLQSKGISYKVTDGGTTIKVPESNVNDLKVDLAAEGIPKSGSIDYSFFGENAGFGMTDKQFDVTERAAVQNELSSLVSNIDGVQSADVMINLPKKSVWVSDEKQKAASASIVLNLEGGTQLDQAKVNGLFRLVSKSVPNLPEDNIVIMDQFFNYYDKKKQQSTSTFSTYQQNQEVKQGIEQNIRRRVQQMLGTMMGRDKVLVNVSTDIDFTKEKQTQELVEPVDKEAMKGLQVSAESVTETYTGTGAAGQVTGEESNIPSNQSATTEDDDGSYKHVEKRINNEFNRIHKDITKSPYELKDMAIQVMVEPPESDNPGSLPQKNVQDIQKILGTIIRTNLNEDGGANLTDQEIADKSVVSVGELNGKTEQPEPENNGGTPIWLYIASAALVAIILVLLFLLFRRRRQTFEKEDTVVKDESDWQEQEDQSPEISREDHKQRDQLAAIAENHPDDFAKLLRTWLNEE